MFSVAPQISSPVSLIGLRGFSPGSHFSLQRFLCSTELAFKERGNCNNVTFRAESSESGNHVTITITQFDFYHNASSSLAPIWNLGFLLDLRSRLLILRTWLLILRTRPLTVYATELAEHLYTSQKDIPLWYYLQIVQLSRYEVRLSSDII